MFAVRLKAKGCYIDLVGGVQALFRAEANDGVDWSYMLAVGQRRAR